MNAISLSIGVDPALLVIGIVVVVLVLLGPKKIPEFARAIRIAKQEYNQAKEVSEET